MSEEQKAIEYLRKHVIPYNNINGNIEFLVNEIILNSISKLQKENEELKEENQRIKDINVELNTDIGSMQTTIAELKEELDYYKQKESQDFDERDYYEE